jgi:ATP-dependent RNA helicase DeaD
MNFEDLKLSKETMESISEIGFEEPTPIQISAIPLIMNGHDIMGQAQTGTGKTAAFGIPIVEKCKRGKNPFAIILEPTRELAVQVAQEINKIGKHKKISVLPVYGGSSLERQFKALKRGVDVVVGTPGRLIDHLHRKTLSLSDVQIVVLDEADEMLDMGFLEDMETILKETPSERQTLLFSATIPQPIVNIAKRYMKSPQKLRVNTKEVIIPKIKQIFYEVREGDKINALSRLLDVEDPQLAIVFCHTKRDVDNVSTELDQMGYNAGALHGDFTQAKRDEVMNKFKGGMLEILVATDVAARGLDIKDVTHVINYSIPQNPDSYVHRIGRTGRAGKSGIAITFVTPREYRHPAEDIAAAALYAAFGELQDKPAAEQYENKGTVRLFMTVGRKDNINAADIVKSIASEARIPFHKIGKIDVFDKFTFVEVPSEFSDKVIRSVNDIVMKGKRVKIQHAKERVQ